MKIVFFIPSLSLGGGQKVVALLAAKISEIHDVSVIVNTGRTSNRLTKLLQESNVSLYFTNGKNGRSVIKKIESMMIIVNYFKQLEPDIINVHLDFYYTWIYALLYRKKIICTVHSDANRFYSAANKLLLYLLNKKKRIDYILLSNANAIRFRKYLNISKDRTYIAPNPIDLKSFDELRNKFGKENDEVIRYINIARFHPVKNHKMLLDSFKIVVNELPNARLDLVGDGELLNEMKLYSERIGISCFCKFWGIIENIEDILINSDIAVLSSKSECLPMFLIESMAMGLPVVSTNVGGVSDMINDNGFLVEEGNSQELALRMIQLGLNSVLRNEMGKKSRKIAEQFDVTNVSKIYNSIFEEVCV